MDTDSLIGKQLGDFLIRERIGRGGMAAVYRAYQASVRRDVALKIIPFDSPDRASDTFRRRFAQEAELIAGLEHIHILPVYAYGITEDAAYLAMRLLRGGTLAGLLRHGPLELGRAIALFCQFASGLRYAHEKGVIHRDLKPGNIMIDDSGHALLADFGLAKMVGEQRGLTQSGTLLGTPDYMSPEQVLGRPLDARADIYSAGVVLYHMVTGQLPFAGPTTDLIATMFQQIHVEPEPPSRLNPAVGPELEAVVLRAMRKEPEDRYPSIGAMTADLDRLQIGRPAAADSSYEGLLDSETLEWSPSTPRPPSGGPGSGQATPLPAERDSGRDAPVTERRTMRLRPLLLAALAVTVIGTLVVLGLGRLREGAGPPPAATVTVGGHADAAAATPSPAEIERARRRLGASGFIAYVTCTQQTAYHATQAREMGDLAARDRLGYRVYDSDGDAYRQVTQIERARADGARGLIVCPLDASLLTAPLAAAEQTGVPLVLLSSGMPSYGGVLIAGDDYAMGIAAGRFAGEIVARERGGRASAVILDYPEVPSLVRRAEGLEQGLLQAAPNARVVAHARGGTREFAAESVGELIAKGNRFDVVLSINDAGSFGAIAALERAGIGPDAVLIGSVDAEELARDYIGRGYYLRGSVATDREQFSRAALGAMVRLLAGSALPETFVVRPGPVIDRDTLQAVR